MNESEFTVDEVIKIIDKVAAEEMIKATSTEQRCEVSRLAYRLVVEIQSGLKRNYGRYPSS
jgi:hypothetical protein